MNLITAKKLKERVGNISDMTVWRWTHDERLRFPQPIHIQRRRYWREEEVEAWLAERALISLKKGA